MSSPFEVFRSPLTVYRWTDGAYVNGRWVEATQTTIPITASIQPTTGEDTQLVPEGRNPQKTYKLYTSTPIKTISDTNPDQIEIFGERYEVIQVFPWQNNANFAIVNHYKFIAMLIDPLTPAPEPP